MILQSQINDYLTKNFDVGYWLKYETFASYNDFIHSLEKKLKDKNLSIQWTRGGKSKSYSGQTYEVEKENEPYFSELTDFLIHLNINMPYLVCKKIEESVSIRSFEDNDYYSSREKMEKSISIQKIIDVFKELNYYQEDQSLKEYLEKIFDEKFFQSKKLKNKKMK